MLNTKPDEYHIKLKDDVDIKEFLKKYKFKRFNGNKKCYVKYFKYTDIHGGNYDELRIHIEDRQLVFMSFNTDYDDTYLFLLEIKELVEIVKSEV